MATTCRGAVSVTFVVRTAGHALAYEEATALGAQLVLFAGASAIDPLDPAYAELTRVGGLVLQLGDDQHRFVGAQDRVVEALAVHDPLGGLRQVGAGVHQRKVDTGRGHQVQASLTFAAGKLLAALAFVGLMIVAAIPISAIVLMYGGASIGTSNGWPSGSG